MTRSSRQSPSRAAAAQPRTKSPDERRQDLLDAGEKVFLAKGVASATVEDITSAAGVAKGTFYLYFAAKDDLLEALRERFALRFSQRVDARVAALAGSWADKLGLWAEAGIEAYLEQVALHDVLFHTAPTPAHIESGRTVRFSRQRPSGAEPPLASLAEFLRQGHAAGAWQCPHPELSAVMLFYALHGVVDHAISQPAPDYAGMKQAARDFFRNSVGLGQAGD